MTAMIKSLLPLLLLILVLYIGLPAEGAAPLTIADIAHRIAGFLKVAMILAAIGFALMLLKSRNNG